MFAREHTRETDLFICISTKMNNVFCRSYKTPNYFFIDYFL